MPVVSIVVPYFSHQDFLLESVRSALAQTCADIEVICVDDASPVAKAGDILSGLDDRRLKIIQRKENGGSAAAKNTGIRESSAQLPVPLDSDDLLAPDYVEVTLERLEREPDAGGVYTQTLVFGQQNFLHSPDCSIATILARQPVPTTCLLRR